MDEEDIDKLLNEDLKGTRNPCTDNIISEIQLDTKLMLLKIISRKLEAHMKVTQWRNLALTSLTDFEKVRKLSEYSY
jgi:sensor domain CHASE-containing protein